VIPLLRHSDRLIGGQVLASALLVWSVLLGFDAIGALGGAIEDIGQGDYSLLTALAHTAYTVPRRAYELFPTAAMIGCVLGLGGLAASSELTALRAAGLSKLRICAGAIAAVGLLTVLMVLSGETLGPWGEQRAQALQLAATTRDVALAEQSGIWAREGDTFLNARRGKVEGEAARSRVVLDEVRLYEFNASGRLRALAVVAQAVHANGRWTLHQVHRSVFEARAVRVEVVDEESWSSQLTPEVLNLSLQRPRYLSTATLRESLDYLERNQLDPGQFAVAYWARWFYPAHALVLCLAALPFAFGTLRSGGFGKRLFIGLVFGLGYFLLQRLSVDLAQVYGVDLRLANLMPMAAVGAGVWTWLRRSG
jgi:lipopolysaccharide export system permease protein